MTAGGRTLDNIATRIGDAIQLADTCAPNADCTAAFNAVALLAGAAGKAIRLPPYTFNLTGNVTLSTHATPYNVTLIGYGPAVSQIKVSNNAAILYRGGQTGNVDSKKIVARDFRILTTETTHTATAIFDMEWQGRVAAYPGYNSERTAQVSNVEIVSGQTGPNWGAYMSFNGGFRFFNANGLRFERSRVRNNYPNVAGTKNILIGGDQQPADMFTQNIYSQFGDYGWYVTSAGSGQGWEALELRDNVTIFNNKGIFVDSPSVHDLLKIVGSNFNNAEYCVSSRNIHNTHLLNNLFYGWKYDNGGVNPDPIEWNGVILASDDPSATFAMNNKIEGNSFFNYYSTATKRGVKITSPNGANTATLIDGNSFAGMTEYLNLGSSTNNILFADTNHLNSPGATFTNAGSPTTNTIARTFADPNGWTRGNDGSVRAWGTSSLVVDSSNNVTVPLTGNYAGAFTSRPYVATAQNSFPGAGPTRVLSWNQNTSTATQLVFYVAGATPGDNFQLSWRADGR